MVTTVYATLGEMAVVDAVNELHSNTLLCNRKAVENLAKLRSKVPASPPLLLPSSPAQSELLPVVAAPGARRAEQVREARARGGGLRQGGSGSSWSRAARQGRHQGPASPPPSPCCRASRRVRAGGQV